MSTALVMINKISFANVRIFWIEVSLIGRLPLSLQICKWPPWRKWHWILLERGFSCINHYLKKLFQPGQGTRIYDWKWIQYSVIWINSSSYFKVTPEININDQTLRGSSAVVVDHINIFMIPCITIDLDKNKCQWWSNLIFHQHSIHQYASPFHLVVMINCKRSRNYRKQIL